MAVNRLMAKLIEKRNLAGNFWLFRFGFEEDFVFTTGQYVSIKVSPEGMRRSYSIGSLPNGKEIELIVDISPMGVGTNFLSKLNIGDEVEMMGPMGHFRVAEPKYNKVLFVATGSGIVPFKAMIADLLERQKFVGEIYLSWGMRHIKNLFWVDEFKEMERSFSNFEFDPVLSQPEGEWSACSGHVNDCLVKHKPTWVGWEAYICGGQKMIADVAALLEKLGVKKGDIHFEKFF